MNMLLAFGATEITLCVLAGLFLIALIIYLIVVPMKLLMLAITSGCYISSAKLVSMKKRNLDAKLIVDTYIASRRAGLKLTVNDYESHLQAGGNIEKLMKAMLLAQQSNIHLDLEIAKAIEKSGENIVKVVESVVIPQVLPFSNVIGMSQDNIELIVAGKITVKANLKRFIGGVQEETLIARVTNEIVNCINDSQYYNIVLESPSIIADVIKGKKLDSGSAFDILSVDITSVRIGENYNLRNIREAADKKKIEIGIETERLKQNAILEEQRAKVKFQEAKIELVKQEKQFNASLYEAVKNKDFDALEYFKLKNLQADTEMRNLIAHPEKDSDMDSLFDED